MKFELHDPVFEANIQHKLKQKRSALGQTATLPVRLIRILNSSFQFVILLMFAKNIAKYRQQQSIGIAQKSQFYCAALTVLNTSNTSK